MVSRVDQIIRNLNTRSIPVADNPDYTFEYINRAFTLDSCNSLAS